MNPASPRASATPTAAMHSSMMFHGACVAESCHVSVISRRPTSIGSR
jgi:hypothetical protein